jgi:hypothetical protein
LATSLGEYAFCSNETTGWTLTKYQQLMKLNMGTDAKPQMVKINA